MRNKIFATVAILYIAVSTSFIQTACYAQAAFLDPTFGGDGIVTTDLGGFIDQAYSLVIQSDGKIILAGHSNSGFGTTKDMVLVRYDTYGNLDPDFGIGGIVKTDFGIGYDDYAFSVALQPDNKIVVVGSSFSGSGYRFAIARYNSDGSLDPSFGVGGLMTTNFGGLDDWAKSVIILADGKILAGGYRNDGMKHNFALIRCNTDGSLDDTFGLGGKVYTSFDDSTHDQAYSMGIQIDNKIVLAGYSYKGTTADYELALTRYNIDGSLDTTFDHDGMLLTTVDVCTAEGYSVQIQHDGKIIIGGYTFIGDDIDFILARYKGNGAIDEDFGVDGIVRTDFGSDNEDNAYAILLQLDGKILAAGDTRTYSGGLDFALARYNNNGTLDTAFGTDGKIITKISPGPDAAQAVAIQPDGKIVAAGYSQFASGIDFAAVRYTFTAPVITAQDEIDPAKISIQAYPNPFGNQFILNSPTNGELVVYDITGNELTHQTIASGHTTISAAYWPAGFYLLRFTNGLSYQNLILVKK